MTSANDTDPTQDEMDHSSPAAYDDSDLQALAVAAGVLDSTSPLTPELREFAHSVVDRCASIGDKYKDQDGLENAGEEIRAAFGLG